MLKFPVPVPRAPMIMGAADGLTCAMGIICGLAITHQSAAVIWTAALSAGIAEFPGMASGQYQSAPEDGKLAALVCGLASTAGAVLPAFPFLAWSGGAAVAASVVLAVLGCLVIAWLRPDHAGLRAVWQSFAITGAAVGLCLLGGLVTG